MTKVGETLASRRGCAAPRAPIPGALRTTFDAMAKMTTPHGFQDAERPVSAIIMDLARVRSDR